MLTVNPNLQHFTSNRELPAGNSKKFASCGDLLRLVSPVGVQISTDGIVMVVVLSSFILDSLILL
ncbi:unnamed protein product [Brugia pahangi]|uniref:Uncharacterized protein n=1 Tax=Brugia pahangi TaxID=6280 RepID=A0A0N4SX68_BRUPA|nr:unnamed protein product [Brugia pahangi]